MHDKPGVIIVDLTLPHDQLQQALDDAFDSADFAFNTATIAVFSHGYKESK